MDIITEYDFEIQRRLFQQQRNLVGLIFKDLCKYFCQPDSNYNSGTCFHSEFVVQMEACNRFRIYLPLNLCQEAAIYIHNHSPCAVFIQSSGAISKFAKDFMNGEGFLSSDSVKTILSLHLGKAFYKYVNDRDDKRTHREKRYSSLHLSYTNVLQVNSDYGDFSVEVLPVIKVQERFKGWFSRDYICSPLFFVARRDVADKFPSPDLVWALSFLDRELEVEHRYQRLFVMSLIFVEKFNLKVIQRNEILQALLRLESDGNGTSKSFLDVLSSLNSIFSSRCLHNFFVKKKVNMMQFENEVEMIKASDITRRYLKYLRSYYFS